MHRSGFYRWNKSYGKGKRHKEDEEFKELIKQIFEQSRETYGILRVHAELKRRGFRIGHNRVAKLMREKGLHSKRRKKYKITTDSRHGFQVAPNIVARDFHPDAPDKIWASDITYVRTYEGWLYFCSVLDLFSARVIGWSFKSSIIAELVIEAYLRACHVRRPPKGVIFHSDRGVQYCSQLLKAFLSNYGAIPSMSRKGNCWDNAPAESFFSTLKLEEVNKVYKTRQEATSCIFEYIEVFYNRTRLHSSLDYKSPEEYEADFLSKKSVYKIG